MRTWYYAKAGKQFGPLEEEVLRSLFVERRLPMDTMVWTEGMANWMPASTFEVLVPADAEPEAATPPPPPPPPVQDEPPPMPSRKGRAVHPWHRYWARYIDIFLYGSVGGIFLSVFYERAFTWSDLTYSMMFLLSYAFVEPILITTFGTTPGKALFRIRLRNRDGSILNYRQAFDRSLKVYLRGEGLGIPILALFLHMRAYSTLMSDGITSWDKEGGVVVEHDSLSPARNLVLTGIVLTLVGIILWAQGISI
ncbi:MAG: RDD family protein [Planctomycetota bacterium]